MLQGKCQLLKIYINEDSKYKSHNLVNVLVSRFRELGIEGLTIMRGIEGYGRKKELHTVKILDLSSSLPLIIDVVDTPEKIEKAVNVARQIVTGGLMLITEVEVLPTNSK
jgi:uncharacterized protein